MNATKLKMIKSTASMLKDYSREIGTRFYSILFAKAPELYNMFNQTNQKRGLQQEALTYAVYAAGENLDHLKSIEPLIMRVAEKHVALGVKPEHYPIVGEALLQAVKDVLGSQATDEVIDAWGEAYNAIADTFIKLEHELYEEKERKTGGWHGFRDFRIVKKVKETNLVTSFYLRPNDQQPIPSFEPGQYLTLKADIEGEAYTHMRHYSLSDALGKDYYRISVKREEGNEEIPGGIVSKYLHHHVQEGDTLPFAVPSGDFTMIDDNLPTVLIGGGIGLTPLMSMLNSLAETGQSVTYIHATQNSSTHTMKEHVEQLTSECHHVTSHVCYSNPTEEDRLARNFDKEGFINLDWLKSTLLNNEANFYFCGPVPFMKAINKALKDWGVSEKHMHYEAFSPVSILEEEKSETPSLVASR